MRPASTGSAPISPREKLSIEPRLKRWQELFLTLKAIEQEL